MSRWPSPISMPAPRRRTERSFQNAPRGHKFAVKPIAAGEAVVKFNQIIGFAKEAIGPGEWVHEHNCNVGEEHGAFNRDYAFSEGVTPVDFCPRGAAGDVPGLSPARWPASAPLQLCRHPHLGELLDHGRRLHRPGDRALRHSRRLSAMSTASSPSSSPMAASSTIAASSSTR